MLQNTDWVTGVVTYTGKQTKLSLNQQPPRSRMSTLENVHMARGGLWRVLPLASQLTQLSTSSPSPTHSC